MSGPRGAIVLLHGVASNRTRWSELAAATSLRQSWRLLAPDLRGHGDAPRRDRIGMAEWCADLARLLDESGHAQAIIAGHCLGANIALNFAARFPGRTAGLVLIEPMPPEALTGKLGRVKDFRFVLRGFLRLVLLLNALGLHRRRVPLLDLEKLDRETRAALAQGPEGERRLAKYASPLADLRTTATGVYLQDLLAVTEPLPQPERIAAPALALVSAQGAFTDPEKVTVYLRRLPSCEIATLPARHWIPTEEPQAMREAIEAWIARRFPDGS